MTWGSLGVIGVHENRDHASAHDRLHLRVTRSQRHDEQPVDAVQRSAPPEIGIALFGIGDVAENELVLGGADRLERAPQTLHR